MLSARQSSGLSRGVEGHSSSALARWGGGGAKGGGGVKGREWVRERGKVGCGSESAWSSAVGSDHDCWLWREKEKKLEPR